MTAIGFAFVFFLGGHAKSLDGIRVLIKAKGAVKGVHMTIFGNERCPPCTNRHFEVLIIAL